MAGARPGAGLPSVGGTFGSTRATRACGADARERLDDAETFAPVEDLRGEDGERRDPEETSAASLSCPNRLDGGGDEPRGQRHDGRDSTLSADVGELHDGGPGRRSAGHRPRHHRRQEGPGVHPGGEGERPWHAGPRECLARHTGERPPEPLEEREQEERDQADHPGRHRELRDDAGHEPERRHVRRRPEREPRLRAPREYARTRGERREADLAAREDPRRKQRRPSPEEREDVEGRPREAEREPADRGDEDRGVEPFIRATPGRHSRSPS